MNLTKQILEIILPMKRAFFQQRTFLKFIGCIFAILCTPGRHTITAILHFLNLENADWSSTYRFFSKAKWDTEICFDELLKKALEKVVLKGRKDILIAIDDFKIIKTGKTIPHTRYILDPKSFAFNPNITWGHRYLHATFVVYKKKRGSWRSAKSITIKLQLAPHIQKPGKRASEKDWEDYENEKKEHNLQIYTIKLIKELRILCDELGYADRNIFVVADGGYCNKTILRNCPDRVELTLRCRKDAKLCEKSQDKRRFYGSQTFTPHDLYKDQTIVARIGSFFYGRNIRRMKYKEKLNVYWQTGAQKRPLRCITVHGVRYRRNKNGYLNYREPMYLLSTDLTSDVKKLIQFYFYRWEIEVNHREIKNDLGIGQPQVWNEKSVERCPKLIALSNSIIHLAQMSLRKRDEMGYMAPPKWYKTRKRISLEYLRRRLREEVINNDLLNEIIGLSITWKDLLMKIAA